jgi:hypothetical protein
MPPSKAELGHTPMTDPRSVAVSLVVNGALLIGASLMALGVVLPTQERPEPRVLRGELEPTDNRAYESGGGSPGELGGEGVELSAERRQPVPPTRDPAADAILAEVLPTRPAAEPSRTLPGPSMSGLGLIRGPGAGGGGGEGTGSGGGTGRGIGPGTEFFGLRDRAGSYAYVIDCSGSMDLHLGSTRGRNVLDVAKRELLASLDPLPSDAKIGVIFYNQNPTVFTDPAGRKELMTASASNKARIRTRLDEMPPVGGTDHVAALRAALAMRPEVIFFLTDADFLDPAAAEAIRREAGKTRILAVEFGVGSSIHGSEPLRRLADATGGSYKYINVWTLRGTVPARP